MTCSVPAPTTLRLEYVMAKYSEIVALLEWVDQKSKQKTSKVKVRNPFKDPRVKDIDIPAYMRKKKEELEYLEKFLKEFNKKEEKKDGKKIRMLTGVEWFVIGLISYPFVGPAYQAIINNMHLVTK